MTTPPLLGDSSDRQIELAKAQRVNGGTAAEWLAWLRRNPDATLPAGVGGLLVRHLTTPGERTPAVDSALRWHVNGLRISPDAPSGQHVNALLWYLGWELHEGELRRHGQ